MMKIQYLSTICLVCFVALVGCGSREGERVSARKTVSGVTIATIQPVEVDTFSETSGTVRAKTVSVVASRVMGTVTAVYVKEGDRVRAGDILLTIDNADGAQRVKAAEAGLSEAQKGRDSAAAQHALAQTTYKRYKNLFDEKVISGQEMDQIETQKKIADAALEGADKTVARATAGLEEARAYNAYASPRAPLSGIVSEKKIDTGNMAMPGMPLVTVEDTSGFKVEAFADEGLAGKTSKGMAAFVLFDGMKNMVVGKIAKTAPFVDPRTRTFLVEVALAGTSFRTGQYAKILIPIGRHAALIVPSAAIVERGQLTGVYVVDDKGIVAYRLVKAGRTQEKGVEIISGLMTGERVITAGIEKVVDGAMVKQ